MNQQRVYVKQVGIVCSTCPSGRTDAATWHVWLCTQLFGLCRYLPNFTPVHSHMFSTHLFLWLPCLSTPFTVSAKMVFSQTWWWEIYCHATAVCVCSWLSDFFISSFFRTGFLLLLYVTCLLVELHFLFLYSFWNSVWAFMIHKHKEYGPGKGEGQLYHGAEQVGLWIVNTAVVCAIWENPASYNWAQIFESCAHSI